MKHTNFKVYGVRTSPHSRHAAPLAMYLSVYVCMCVSERVVSAACAAAVADVALVAVRSLRQRLASTATSSTVDALTARVDAISGMISAMDTHMRGSDDRDERLQRAMAAVTQQLVADSARSPSIGDVEAALADITRQLDRVEVIAADAVAHMQQLRGELTPRREAALVVAAAGSTSASAASSPLAAQPRRCVLHRDVPHVFKSDLHGTTVHEVVAQLTARGTGSADSGSRDGSGAGVGSGGGVAVGVSVAASGMGGVGKTVLALQAFKHADVVCVFGRRRYWLTLGEGPDVLALVNDLLSDLAVDLTAAGVSLGDAAASVSSIGEACEALDALLRLMTAGGRRVLLVLDDVWKADHARPFLLHLHATLGEHWRRVCGVSYLLTSRQSALLSRQLGAVVQELGAVSGDASLDLFWRCCGVDAMDAARRSHDAAARRICSRVCGGVALALQMVGGRGSQQAGRWRRAGSNASND